MWGCLCSPTGAERSVAEGASSTLTSYSTQAKSVTKNGVFWGAPQINMAEILWSMDGCWLQFFWIWWKKIRIANFIEEGMNKKILEQNVLHFQI